MLVPRSACLICSTFGRRLNSGARGKRKRTASSKAGPNETFNASQLVLDLDAADSKYVRRYDQSKDLRGINDSPEPTPDTAHRKYIRGHDESKDRRRVNSSDISTSLPFARETDRSKARKMKLNQTFVRPQDIYASTIEDYFSLALTDKPSILWSPRKSLLGVVFRNQVPRTWHADFDNGNISPATDLLSESPQDPSKKDLHKVLGTIRYCNTMLVLQRATRFLTQSLEGCHILALNGTAIVHAIRESRANKEDIPSPSLVLRYIANLTAKLEAKGVDIGPSICDMGLYYASRTADLLAVKRFVDLAVNRHHPALEKPYYRQHSHRHDAAQNLASNIWSSNHGTMDEDVGRRVEATLRLLTGWNVAGVPGQNEERKPSFANFATDCADMYRCYLLSLGRIGATEALWYEWINPDVTPAPASLNAADRADVFAAALDCVPDQLKAFEESKETLYLSYLQQAIHRRLLEESHAEPQKAVAKSPNNTAANTIVDKLIDVD